MLLVHYIFVFIITSEASYQSTVMEKKVRKKCPPYAKKRAPILPASDSELRPLCLAYTDPSGERQRAPSTPWWGPSSLQRSFRRALASSVHAAVVGSTWPTQILPASNSEHLPRRSSGVRQAFTDPSGERQRAPSTPRWGPSSLQRSFRRAIASSDHTCF